MAEPLDNGLSAIEVDADDYATPLASDTPNGDIIPHQSRTYQSEAAFQAQKAAYHSAQDQRSQGVRGDSDNYAKLIQAIPALGTRSSSDFDDIVGGGEKTRLGKKDFQLLGYVVGEMYFEGEYARVVELCARVKGGLCC